MDVRHATKADANVWEALHLDYSLSKAAFINSHLVGFPSYYVLELERKNGAISGKWMKIPLATTKDDVLWRKPRSAVV